MAVSVFAEEVTLGVVVDDDRFPEVFVVGHKTVGPKWVTFRAFHPNASVYPNPPRRVARGGYVRVRSQ